MTRYTIADILHARAMIGESAWFLTENGQVLATGKCEMKPAQ